MKKEFDTCSYGFVTADPKAQLIHIGENTLRVKPTQVNLMAHLIGHADTSVALPDLQEELGIRSKESFKVTVSTLRGVLKKISLDLSLYAAHAPRAPFLKKAMHAYVMRGSEFARFFITAPAQRLRLIAFGKVFVG